MGRRSINTTKSGKYMNPTDQARKEARKKELKKNKKQRQMVRAAVLKMKDPAQILEELEKIDDMEFNVLQPSPLNEKVLKEKRKKLRETFDRVLKMYEKDEPDKWVELKRQEVDYEKRRAHLMSYYESVRHAQSVQIDDIPLPTLQVPENLIYGNLPSQIPLPLDINPMTLPMHPVKPILKKNTIYKDMPIRTEPPGVPTGPPPDLAEVLLEDDGNDIQADFNPKKNKTLRFAEDTEKQREELMEYQLQEEMSQGENRANIDEDEEFNDGDTLTAPGDLPDDEQSEISRPMSPSLMAAAALKAAAPKPTSLQQRMLALSGQNIDEFMKEMEEVHKKREKDRRADLNARLSALDKDERRKDDSDSGSEDEQLREAVLLQNIPNPPGTEPPMRPQMPPPLLPGMFRPPPLRMPGPPPLRMPPGPPPGRPNLPPGPPPGLPPRAMLRMPPGPPPGAPPRLMRPIAPPIIRGPAPVLSAAPQLINRKEGSQGATISAKPQIRNLSADVTRFVPSALRVKREDKKPKSKNLVPETTRPAESIQKAGPTKDDAYMQFMREMQGLI